MTDTILLLVITQPFALFHIYTYGHLAKLPLLVTDWYIFPVFMLYVYFNLKKIGIVLPYDPENLKN
jgi:hypothetical protein